MSRRGTIVHRVTPPDTRYGNRVVQKFINKLMLNGKKSVAESILYGSLDRIEEQTKRHPMESFETALRNVTPILEVKPKRVGGATYQVPVEIRGDRRQALAIRCLIGAARKRAGKKTKTKMSEIELEKFASKPKSKKKS